MSTPNVADSSRLAKAKEIGVDVEFLVVRAIEGVRLADDPDAFFDAETTSVLDQRTLAEVVAVPVAMVTPLVEADTKVEIKATIPQSSNGAATTAGRWAFKGREDGQHAKLLDAAGYYALAVYDDTGDRELVALALLPATVVDDLLEGRWYDIDRDEDTMARLGWTHVLDEEVIR